jgi:hypothetical protein
MIVDGYERQLDNLALKVEVAGGVGLVVGI